MGKKAQVKFGESIGVIFIVFFIIMTGLIWYDKINTKSLNKIDQQDQENRAFEKYHYLKELDLIHVSERGIVEKELSLYSLLIFSNYSKTPAGKKYLEKRLSNSLIEMFVYENEQLSSGVPYLNITLYNQSSNREFKKSIIFVTYFPIKDFNKQIKIGKLKITSYIS